MSNPPSTPLALILRRIGRPRARLAAPLGVSPALLDHWTWGINTRRNPSPPPPEVMAYFQALADGFDAVEAAVPVPVGVKWGPGRGRRGPTKKPPHRSGQFVAGGNADHSAGGRVA